MKLAMIILPLAANYYRTVFQKYSEPRSVQTCSKVCKVTVGWSTCKAIALAKPSFNLMVLLAETEIL